MSQARLDVRPLSGAMGAEIRGVDLAGPPDEGTAAALRSALLEHQVLVLRGQELTGDQFMAAAERFGEPVEYPFVRGIEGFPRIIEVSKLEHERVNFGGIWHSDTVYLDTPPKATLLLARELPPRGGDTLFANQELAYETLSEGMQRLLGGLVAVHSSAKAEVTRTRGDRLRDSGKAEAEPELVSRHPVVRTHPETGRKALYVNVAHTVRFEDMTEEESAPLLTYLFAHQTRPELTCRVSWEPGTLTIWDNRSAQHYPINDYHGYRRILHRITLKGERPFQ